MKNTEKNLRFQVVPVSPAATETPLQMICFFDQTKNQIMEGGTADVDSHMGGVLQELRRSDRFRGELFETFFLTPRKGEIPAERLLLIGLGDPDLLSAERLQWIGRLIVQEAIKFGVPSFAFAPDVRDAGITRFRPQEISHALGLGMKEAWDSALALSEKSLLPKIQLQEMTLLASGKHLADAQEGLNQALSTFQP